MSAPPALSPSSAPSLPSLPLSIPSPPSLNSLSSNTTTHNNNNNNDTTKKKNKWATVSAFPATGSSLDLSAPGLVSAPDISPAALDWSSCTGVTKSLVAINPVWFFRLATGIVVVKAGPGVGQEYFAFLFASLCAAPVAQCRLITTSSAEFSRILHGVSLVEPEDSWKQTQYEFNTLFQRSVAVLIIEYIQDSTPHAGSSSSSSSSSSVSSMQLPAPCVRDIGGLVALDLIMFNIDRFPLFMKTQPPVSAGAAVSKRKSVVEEGKREDETKEGEMTENAVRYLTGGNLSNLLVCQKRGRTFGIDQGCKRSTNSLHYATVVQRLLSDFASLRDKSRLILSIGSLLSQSFQLPSDFHALLTTSFQGSLSRVLQLNSAQLHRRLVEQKNIVACALAEDEATRQALLLLLHDHPPANFDPAKVPQSSSSAASSSSFASSSPAEILQWITDATVNIDYSPVSTTGISLEAKAMLADIDITTMLLFCELIRPHYQHTLVIMTK